jgi:F-type H+-transporting ATPase subunit alpha
MQAFSQFASDLDPSTQKLLARGARLTELLKQPQFHPLPVEEQAVVIFAGVRGLLDRVPVGKIVEFERRYVSDLKTREPGILDAIRNDREIKSDVDKKLTDFITKLVDEFVS